MVQRSRGRGDVIPHSAELLKGHRDHFAVGGSVAPEGSRNMILPPPAGDG